MPYISLKLNPQPEKKSSKPLLIPFFISFLFGFLITLFFLKSSRIINSNQASSSIKNSQKPDTQGSGLADLNTLGILLLGYGGAGHPGGYLTDAIQVLYLDLNRSTAYLISVPRDLYLKFDDGHGAKINTAAAYFSRNSKNIIVDGAKPMENLLGKLLGININYFIGVDFVGFQRAVGLHLKSLDVEVAETLDDPWYPVEGKELEPCGKTDKEIKELTVRYSGFDLEKQFPCRYEHLLYKAGSQKMEAGEALKYARSRHGSSLGDISRNKRQQEVLTAVKNKMISLGFAGDLPAFFRDISDNIETDIDLGIVKSLAPLVKSSANFKNKYINLGTGNVLASGNIGGASVIVPKEGFDKWNKIREFITTEINSE